jgi:hypothetical protein
MPSELGAVSKDKLEYSLQHLELTHLPLLTSLFLLLVMFELVSARCFLLDL